MIRESTATALAWIEECAGGLRPPFEVAQHAIEIKCPLFRSPIWEVRDDYGQLVGLFDCQVDADQVAREASEYVQQRLRRESLP